MWTGFKAPLYTDMGKTGHFGTFSPPTTLVNMQVKLCSSVAF